MIHQLAVCACGCYYVQGFYGAGFFLGKRFHDLWESLACSGGQTEKSYYSSCWQYCNIKTDSADLGDKRWTTSEEIWHEILPEILMKEMIGAGCLEGDLQTLLVGMSTLKE